MTFFPTYPNEAIATILTLVLAAELGQPVQKPRKEERRARETLPMSVEDVGDSSMSVIDSVPQVLRWQGSTYAPDEAIKVLTSVIRDPGNDTKDREDALSTLGMLGTSLQAHACIKELIEMFPKASNPGIKRGIVLCLVKSQDPRSLQLFHDALTTETEVGIRLFAAVGLAQWNIRGGVAELIELLKSEEHLGFRTVRDEAADSFRSLNRRRAWGFPEQNVRTSCYKQAAGSTDDFMALYIASLKEWFAVNEHRFPDWKSGDPLPELPESEKKQRAEEQGGKR